MAVGIRAFQVFYDDKTRALLDPEFEPLDNSKNERPDWYEYWPIRAFLSGARLDDSAYYGFLSPRFFEKTRLSARKVMDFLRRADGADVVTFSPFPCHAAVFFNVFEQGEFFHRGLYDVAGEFFGEFGGTNLDALVMHSGNTVYSNFFFARARFWKSWKMILDRLFELAETRTSPLYIPLKEPLEYAKEDGTTTVAQMKVFVMERAISFLLATGEGFTAKNYPPFDLPLSPKFAGKLDIVVALDALKLAFCRTGDPSYLRRFREERKKVFAEVWPGLSPRL